MPTVYKPEWEVDPYSWAMGRIMKALTLALPNNGLMSEEEYSILSSIYQVIEERDPASLVVRTTADKHGG